ncbi:MAG: GST-like protein [Hyphomicrobiales bacterium]|nr:MAPEG family protein [Hyphomicrobiales bacterium]PCH50345.1 MAG: GST-like protein [Hyphomicrobiales bacterium]
MEKAFQVIAIYAGFLGLIFIWLGWEVGKIRRRDNVSIGDEGNIALIRRMRGQLNFVECVPIILILAIVMAVIGAPYWLFHIGGIALVAARFFHGLYFTRDEAPYWQRAVGAVVTLGILAICSLSLIGHGLYRLVY